MDSDKQFDAMLIDEYYLMRDLLLLAKKTNADEVAKDIEEQMKRIRLKFLPRVFLKDDELF